MSIVETSLGSDVIVRMTFEERFKYFSDNARYNPEAPPRGPHYHIRVGDRTLYADDTGRIHEQFENYVKNLRRSINRRRGNRP